MYTKLDNQLLPTKRIYQNHHLDSTRWNLYQPRVDDVIVTTSYKSGTTWVISIIYQLLYGKKTDEFPREKVVRWFDCRWTPKWEDLAKWVADFKQRRIIKSHLPLDGLPYYPQVKYIIVARDSRDVFMSWYNHYSNYTEHAFKLINETPGLIGNKLPPCPKDPRVAWQEWITRGWFDWENEGYPWWGNMHHTKTFWEFRDLPNFLFLHFNDLLKDLKHYIKVIADFIEVKIDNSDLVRIENETQFNTVKKMAIEASKNSKNVRQFFKGGRNTFIYKGTNGRWKGVLTKEDLNLYEKAKKRILTPECVKWLENKG